MNPWEQWREKEKAAYPLRLRQMHKMYGLAEGHTCRDCKFMIRVRYAKVYLKCGKTILTHGPATDWRATWPACGLFVEDKQKPIPMQS